MADRSARVDSAAQCSALGGQCTCTAPGHPDHTGPVTAITAPHSSGQLIEAQILSFSEVDGSSEIVLHLGWGDNGTEITATEASHVADQLDQFAARLRGLAAELQHLNQN